MSQDRVDNELFGHQMAKKRPVSSGAVGFMAIWQFVGILFGLQRAGRVATHMQIDPSLRTKADNDKILTNLVVPCPIGWVTSRRSTGLVNLAPFSFFNAVGSDPLR
jgi:hypothetical protein